MPRPSMSARVRLAWSASPWRALWTPASHPCGPLRLLSSLFPLDRQLRERAGKASQAHMLGSLLWIALGVRPAFELGRDHRCSLDVNVLPEPAAISFRFRHRRFVHGSACVRIMGWGAEQHVMAGR